MAVQLILKYKACLKRKDNCIGKWTGDVSRLFTEEKV